MKFDDFKALKKITETTDSAALRRHLTQVEHQITGRVFCTACQRAQPAQGGVHKKVSGGRRRFLCAGCAQRMATAMGVRK